MHVWSVPIAEAALMYFKAIRVTGSIVFFIIFFVFFFVVIFFWAVLLRGLWFALPHLLLASQGSLFCVLCGLFATALVVSIPSPSSSTLFSFRREGAGRSRGCRGGVVILVIIVVSGRVL